MEEHRKRRKSTRYVDARGWGDERGFGVREAPFVAADARRIGGREESGAILRGQVLSPRPI